MKVSPPHIFGRRNEDEEDDRSKPVPYFSLFRFSTPVEKMMMGAAFICAVLHGASFPVIMILWGSVIDRFETGEDSSAPPEELTREVGIRTVPLLIIAVALFFVSGLHVKLQLHAAQQQCVRIRKRYLESVLRQDFEWYDESESGDLTSRVAADVDLIQNGIGDRFTSAVRYMSLFFVSIIVAFIYGYKMTLVVLATAPFLFASIAWMAKTTADTSENTQKAYGAAGSIAEEVLRQIRTVNAFGGQKEEIQRYDSKLDVAYKHQVRQGHIAGLSLGVSNFMDCGLYGLSFWFGALLIRRNEMSLGDMFIVFLSITEAVYGLGLAAPCFRSFAAARGVAPRIWKVIDQESKIDPLSKSGRILDSFSGSVALKNVFFNYKGRADKLLLGNINMEIGAGETRAIVGASGCGKSTILRLIERLYDPTSGEITFDGVDIRDLNVQWLRSQIGYVSQMPTLFAASVRDNIAFGAGLELRDEVTTGRRVLRRCDVTDEQIVNAAKLANAHEFISRLPERYNTLLGERGVKLSGGQKQRIAIARAIIRQPQVLILDEATSSLDTNSERVVQDALERASEGRTTIVVAHRLSTVRNADCISFINNGTIEMEGSHDQLMRDENEHYKKLVELQSICMTPEVVNKERRGGTDADTPSLARDLEGDNETVTEDVALKESGFSKPPQRAEEKDTGDVDGGVLLRAISMNMKEWPYIFAGVLGSVLSGSAWPVIAFVFSDISNEILLENRPSEIRKWSLIFPAIGVGFFIGTYLQHAMLGISGERLTREIRSLAFRSLLKQEICYFDRKENSSGALSVRLSTESTRVKEVTGDSLGVLAFAISTIGFGILIAFVGCWRTALFALAVMPFLAGTGVFEMKIVTGFDASSQREFAAAGAVASEAIDNIKTVTLLGIQDIIMAKFSRMLKTPLEKGKSSATISALGFGLSEFTLYALWGSVFWLGARFLETGQCTFLGLMRSVTGIVFGAMMLGEISLRVPAMAASKVAATKLFRLIDRQSQINPSSSSGLLIPSAACQGAVDFNAVNFKYPTRPEVPVLRGLTILISPGKSIAIVGATGCGKSTIISLLLRFYEIQEGEILLDGHETRMLNLNSLRSCISLVPQEPELFSRTIRENIAYGFAKDVVTAITDDQIIDAAKAANAHSFIMQLPKKYDTYVGEHGEQLSGGERQRVAIARSLVRHPRVLCLDEATSALDSTNERTVQEALDAARQGRTTIIVAHRLSTVKDADMIAVVANGKIVECGSHDELMDLNGEYVRLVKDQMEAFPSEDP